jgi:hypothetical protein
MLNEMENKFPFTAIGQVIEQARVREKKNIASAGKQVLQSRALKTR